MSRPDRLARLRLMRVVSDFREGMWGVLQQAISTLDVDFVAYAEHHLGRLIENASGAALEADLRLLESAYGPGAASSRTRARLSDGR